MAAALLAVALLVGGCWGRTEVNDLGIVTMVAVDRADDGKLQLWVHVMAPARGGTGSGGQGADGGGQSAVGFITLSATAESVMEAARRIQVEVPRQLFWAHARVLIIGERLAREGIRPAIEFATRHRELRLTNYVLVARNPEEVMSVQPNLERLAAESLREISRSRIGMMINVGDVAGTLASPGRDPSMGVVEVSPPPKGAPPHQSGSLRMAGTALFRGDKLVAYLDDADTRGLVWLRNQVRQGTATVHLEGRPGQVTVEWIKGQVERTARLDRGRLLIEVNAVTEGEIVEVTAPADVTDPVTLRQINDAFARVLQERIAAVQAKLQELNVDPAGFGNVVRRELPDLWRTLEPRWDEEYPNVRVVVNVQANVRRTGLSGKPRGLSDSAISPQRR